MTKIGPLLVRIIENRLIMKKHLTYLLAVLITVSLSSCYTQGRHNHFPPGKSKKIHGDNSAKKYAPGQKKKSKKNKNSKHQKIDVYYSPIHIN